MWTKKISMWMVLKSMFIQWNKQPSTIMLIKKIKMPIVLVKDSHELSVITQNKLHVWEYAKIKGSELRNIVIE